MLIWLKNYYSLGKVGGGHMCVYKGTLDIVRSHSSLLPVVLEALSCSAACGLFWQVVISVKHLIELPRGFL